jgi:hypothetical protein
MACATSTPMLELPGAGAISGPPAESCRAWGHGTTKGRPNWIAAAGARVGVSLQYAGVE